jgi:hypothetical protein
MRIGKPDRQRERILSVDHAKIRGISGLTASHYAPRCRTIQEGNSPDPGGKVA